jgi:hypothetical protein
MIGGNLFDLSGASAIVTGGSRGWARSSTKGWPKPARR